VGEIDMSDRPSGFVGSVAEFLRSIARMISRAATGFDGGHASTFLVCLAFLLVLFIPTLIAAWLMIDHKSYNELGPDIFSTMLIYLVHGSDNDFSRLTAFITPVFALVAGLRSRTGSQSLFFTLFVCISVLGAVGSLIVKYFLTSPEGFEAFSGNKDFKIDAKMLTTLNSQAKTFFDTSFQTFLSFVSILLGLRAAEK
jgi:hypothetical protein